MRLQDTLLLSVSLLLVIVTAWYLGTFIRLHEASATYENNKMFESACQMSKEYVNVGLWSGSVITLLSLVLLAISSHNMYKNF